MNMPVSCLKITFPYLWFITFVALSGAILNTYNKFAVAAFSPVFLNIAMIGAAILLTPYFDDASTSFGLGRVSGWVVAVYLSIAIFSQSWFIGEAALGLAG